MQHGGRRRSICRWNRRCKRRASRKPRNHHPITTAVGSAWLFPRRHDPFFGRRTQPRSIGKLCRIAT
ncbi:hypothetical protein RHECNPAF_730033 [Rhizobium etli CNPAF512]|nr:hypothetical protein RHECNPAF_730033 [Rhizobium etli CNPAF512]